MIDGLDKSGDRRGKSSNLRRDLKREMKSAWRKRRGGMFGNPGSWVMAYYSPLFAVFHFYK
jgi:hypothetical protein